MHAKRKLTAEDWEDLVARGESKHTDFKAPMAFENPHRGALAMDIIGMSNVRDGGKLVVGAQEDRGKKPVPLGLSDEQLRTFDTTPVATYVNKYVEPPVSLTVGVLEIEGKRLAVVTVQEFATTPTICVKSGPQDPKDPKKQLFYEGDILVRTEQAETRKRSGARTRCASSCASRSRSRATRSRTSSAASSRADPSRARRPPRRSMQRPSQRGSRAPSRPAPCSSSALCRSRSSQETRTSSRSRRRSRPPPSTGSTSSSRGRRT